MMIYKNTKSGWKRTKVLNINHRERRRVCGIIITTNSNFVNDMMHKKNLETDGGYHCQGKWRHRRVDIIICTRSLSDEYHIMNDVLLQTKKEVRN